MKIDSFFSKSDRARKMRRRRIVMICIAGSVGMGMIGVIWIVRYAPIFQLKNIVIRGNVHEQSSDVHDAVLSTLFEGSIFRNVFGTDHMFSWSNKEFRNLAFLPEVLRVQVSKNYFARTVYIDVTERVREGIWCRMAFTDDDNEALSDIDETPTRILSQAFSRGCWWFDKGGVLFARAPGGEGGLLRTLKDYSDRSLGVGDSILPSPLMENIFSVFVALEKNGIIAREVRLDDLTSEDIQVVTAQGPLLYFSLRFSTENITSVLRDAFLGLGKFPPVSKLHYLDFRVENRVYYK
ncbi:MAG: hypothetical protein NUV53_04125 [Patescibacteria group bacterium]|nr:hypothetical protein [Patescibacteria group bacterium]